MITPTLKKLTLAAAALVALSPAAEVQMQAERVALFKNGYACIRMQGKLGEEPRVQVHNMPQPILGSFWWQAPVNIVRLEGRTREVETPSTSFDYSALLQANQGKQAIMELENGMVYRGAVSMLPAPAEEGGSFILPASGGARRESMPDMVMLLTPQGGSVSLEIAQIRVLEFPESEQAKPPTQKTKLSELEIELQAPAPDGTLRLSCLTEGLSWLPTYSLALGEDGNAELVCKATIINDLVDLKNVELELVTGFPALGKFLVPGALVDADRILASIGMLGLEQDEGGMGMMTNMVHRGVITGGLRSGSADSIASADMLNRAEDLFYYTIPNFTCLRGETVMLPVFVLTVPYKHVYTCAVPNQSRLQALSRAGAPIADVFHCVRLTNKGELPWSAGVVTCTSGGRLAARSGLRFTGVEQESLVQLNKTFDAAVACREELVRQGVAGRRVKKQIIGDDEQIPSVYRGYLTITNKSDKPMELELSKAVVGTATEVSDAGQIDISPTYSGNANSSIMWKTTLAPGAEKTFTYTYEYQE